MDETKHGAKMVKLATKLSSLDDGLVFIMI